MDTEIQEDKTQETEKPKHTKLPKTIVLDFPFHHGSKEIKEVIIERHPKTKHMKKVDLNRMSVDDNITILANITDLNSLELEDVYFDDFSVLARELRNLLPNTLRIGKEDSQ